MILDNGGDYVILGHSERRNVFGESDEVSSKLYIKLNFNRIAFKCISLF